MKIDTGDIEAFAAVGATLSFTAAAGQLNISPSALSRRILKLERQLDSALLVRTTREVKLTLAGKQFLERSQEILQGIDQLVTVIRGEGSGRASSVTIACIPSLASSVVPDAMREFSRLHPNVRLKFKDMTTNDVLDAVQSGEADFGITSYGSMEGALEFVSLIRGAFVLVTPKDHPFASRQSLAWSEIEQHQVISTWKGSGVRMVMDVELAKAGRRLAWTYEVQQMYTVLSFVERGLGIAPVPSFFVSPRDRRDLATIPLLDPLVWVDLGLVRNREQPLRVSAAAFWDVLVEMIRRSSSQATLGHVLPMPPERKP